MERGHVAGRGAALASGNTDKVSGGIHWTGGISSNDNTKAVADNTKATKANTDKKKKEGTVFDWVARRLTYLGNKTKEIADKITDYISSTLKSSLLKKQMKSVDKEIAANEKGAAKYSAKAKSAGKGLSSKWINKIQKGDYTIQEINDSGLAERINAYKEWYDKAVSCKQAVQDLKNTQLELFEQWANIPLEKAQKAIDKLSAGYAGLEAISARISAASSGGSTQALLVQEQKNTLDAAKRSQDTAAKNKKTADKKNKDAKKKVDSKAKTLKKSKLTKSEKAKIKAGKTISTKKLSGTKKKRALAYNAAVIAQQKTQAKASSASATNSRANTLANTYAENYRLAEQFYDSGDSAGYSNALVDAQLDIQKKQNSESQTAYKSAVNNTQATAKAKQAAEAKKKNANKKVSSTGKSLAKKYANKLSASQEADLKSGRIVSTKGVKDKTLLKKLNAYNAQVRAAKKATEEATVATQKYNIAQDAEAEAAQKAAQSQAELAEATIEAEKTKFDNIKKMHDAENDYQDSLNSTIQSNLDKALAANAKNYDAQQAAYQQQQDNNSTQLANKRKELNDLQNQLLSAEKNGVKRGSEEWLSMASDIESVKQEIAGCEKTAIELADSIAEAKYAKMFDDAIEKAEKFKDKLDTIKSLINDEMMYDYKTGELTEMGMLSLAIDFKDLENSSSKLQTFIKKKAQLESDLRNGLISQTEYDKQSEENNSNILSELKNDASLKQSILSVIKNQSKAELDAINKVINAHKEALQKKKDYYDYDKTLKKKSKSVNLLKQEVAALENVATAEAKAALARKKAELAEAEDDLDETVKDHVYQLQVDGLSDLSDKLEEDYDEYINKISGNLDEMTKAINSTASIISGGFLEWSEAFERLLKNYGIKPGNIDMSVGDIKLQGNAKGGVIRSANKAIRANGDTLLLSSANPGETILTQKFTDLLPTAVKVMDTFSMLRPSQLPVPEKDVNSNVVVNLSYDKMINIEGNADTGVVNEIKNMIPTISKAVQNDIRKDLRKAGRK